MHDVLILGAGISGLSAAWFLKKQHPHLKIALLERSERTGGWVHTIKSASGQLYETGPRSFRFDRLSPLIELIKDLKLEKEIIFASRTAKKRYLFLDNKVSTIPKWLLIRGALKYFLTSKQIRPQESVFDYFRRRCGKKFADLIADSLVTGIYAGDSRSLSMKHFLRLQRGLRIATLKRGLSSLIEPLQKAFPIEYGTEVHSIEENDDMVRIETNRGSFIAKSVISTLPSKTLPYTSLATVALGFANPVLLPQGFGMLVPTGMHPEFLGVVCDSEIFPQQNSSMKSRCTLMFGGARAPHFCAYSNDDIRAKVREVLLLLGIQETPTEQHIIRAERAIPHFPVGFDRGPLKSKRVFYAGSWASGVSLGDCVAFAKTIALEYS